MISVVLLLCLQCVAHPLSLSQENKIDSLLVSLSNTKEDTLKVEMLLNLANETIWTDARASEKYARQALDISQKSNYTSGKVDSQYTLALIFADYKFDFAEEMVLQALEHAKEMDDSLYIASIYNVLGALKSSLNYNIDALDYYKKSLDIFLRHNQDSDVAGLYCNIGIVYGAMNNDSLALDYYQKAVEINKKIKNYMFLGINYMNIGYELINSGDFEEGFDYLNKSLEIATTHELIRLFPWIYNNLSIYYSKIDNQQETINYANKTLKTARKNGHLKLEAEALTRLKDAYFQKSNTDKAYYYLEQLSIVKDTINKHSRLKELDLLEIKYKFDEERKQQKLERELQKTKYERKEIIYLFSLIGIGLLLALFVLLYFVLKNRVQHRVLEKEKLAQELEYRNKELTTNVMYSIEKNNMLTAISDELFKIEKEAVKEETQDAIQRISKKIQSSTDTQIWNEFETRFQQVHKDFYISLTQKYPNLTPNEKRLCGFLRLDMSSKEISRLTGQSISSLELARYRLRKKLGISKTNTNLNTFLNQF